MKLIRFALLAAVVGLVASAAFFFRETLLPRRPLNVLLITADSLRPTHLTPYGYARATSPNIQRLAGMGTTFLDAYAAAGWTSESMLTIFLGVQSPVHGVIAKGLQVPVGWPLPLGELARAGYEVPRLVPKFAAAKDNYANLGFHGPDHFKTPPREWLQANREKPFFLWIHLMQTHLPYKAPAEHRDFFLKPDMIANVGTRERLKTLQTQIIVRHDTVSYDKNADLPAITAVYDAGVHWMDDAVGKLLADLDAVGLTRDTLVIFSADHGEELLERGNVGHISTLQGGHLHDELIHVPLIVSLPGRIPAGRRVATQVRTVDILPTVFDLMKRPALPMFQGKSLVPVIAGRETADRPVFASSSYKGYQEENPRDVKNFLRAVRIPPWKLYREEFGTKVTDRLYHLATDPGETIDVSAAHPDVLARLRGELDGWLTECSELRNRLAASDIASKPR